MNKMKTRHNNSAHSEILPILIQTINAEGGLGKMWQLFGEQTDKIIQELNEALAA
jgi:type I restriction enzyme R subunit